MIPFSRDRVAERDEIEPAAAALAAGDRAELPPELAHALLSGSSISVGNGPSPTRVTYAFATPRTASIRVGPIPMPVAAAPAIGFDEVTKG